MKRVLALLLALLLVLTTTPLSVFAADGVPAIVGTMDKDTVCPGDTVTLTVSMENNPGLVGWQIWAEYDDSVLTLQEQNAGDAFTGGSLSFGPAQSPANALWYDFINGDYANNGVLFSMTFLVSAEAAEGDVYDIRLYQKYATDTVNSALQAVEFAYESPSVVVGHTYDGTCDEACNRCGATREGSGHLCTKQPYTTCDVCGELRSVKPMIFGRPSQLQLTRGDKFTVTVQMRNNPGLAGWVTELEFDESVLELTAMTPGSVFDNLIFSNPETQSPVKVLWADFVREADCKDNGVMFRLTFCIKEDAPLGQSRLNIQCSDPDNMLNMALEAVPFTFVSTAVEVVDHIHVYDNACDATCNECGAIREVPDHVYTDACDGDCDVCGATRVAPHAYSADCDYTCDACGVVRPTVSAAHTYDHGCDTDCNACGETREIQHIYSNACDSTCNVCGAERVPADHVYTNACDAYCDVCGAYREPANHVYDNECDAYCNVCGAYRVPSEHLYVLDSTVAPSCTVSGSETYVCSVCGDTYTVSLPAPGHRYGMTIIAPTCETMGYTLYSCAYCNASYKDSYVDALGHQYGEWITTIQPTCDANGSKQAWCSYCNTLITESIPANGHQYTDAVVLPSCVAQGYTLHVCSVCNHGYADNYTEVIPHTYGDWVIDKDATLLAEGSQHHICSVCKRREDQAIPRIEIDITTNENYGLANFTVVDAQTLAPMANAQLFISTDADGENTFTTDAEGKVSIVLPVGKQAISAYASGCLVRNLNVTVNPGVNEIPAIGLSARPTYEAEITSKPMTQEEIIDAGIDITAPGNQHVFKYEMKLEFEADIDWESIVFYFNDDGKFLGGGSPNPVPDPDPVDPVYYLHYHVVSNGMFQHTDCKFVEAEYGQVITLDYQPKHPFYIFDGWYSDETFTQRITMAQVLSTNTKVYGRWLDKDGEPIDPDPSVPVKTKDGDTVRVYPVNEYFYLLVRGEVTWQKEMFDVEMLVFNNSETDTLTDLRATLNLPDGLSLAPMVAAPQQATQYLPTIEGGGSASVHWYVRGDKTGSYNLEARLQGMVMPFEEPIDDIFTGKNQLTVWGGDALHLHFSYPDATWYAENYTITATLTNVSNVTLYNVQHLVQAQQGMKVWYSNGETKVDVETSNWNSSGLVMEFHPGDQIIMEITTNIFFQSEVMEYELQKYIEKVNNLEDFINGVKVVSAVAELASVLIGNIEGGTHALDTLLDTGTDLFGKAEFVSDLLGALSDLTDGLIDIDNKVITVGAAYLGSLGTVLNPLTYMNPIEWVKGTPVEALEQAIKDAQALRQVIADPNAIVPQTFDIFDSIRTAIAAIPIVFNVQNAILNVDESSTTKIPCSFSSYDAGPHYFGVKSVSKYLNALKTMIIDEIYGEVVPDSMQWIPGLDDPFNRDAAIEEIQATEREIAQFQAKTSTRDIVIHARFVPNAGGSEADYTLSSDNETAKFENGVLTFTGDGNINLVPNNTNGGTLYVEDSEGHSYTCVVDVVEQHTCTPGAQETVMPPSGGIDGFAVKRCTVCSDIMDIIILAAEDCCEVHTYGAWEQYSASDCETRGMNVRTCSVCAAVEYVTVGGDGHVCDDWSVTKQPTCITAGEKVGNCSVCGQHVVSTIVPEGHREIAHVEAVAPTCYNDGMVEYWYCVDCGDAWLDADCTLETTLLAVVLPAAHGEIVHVAAVDPTCTANGNLEYWYCADCGAAWLDAACILNTNLLAVVLPAAHGELVWNTITEPTAFTEGLRQQTCTVCGDVVLTEAIPMTDESFGYGENANNWIVGLPLETTPAMLVAHYANMGLEAVVTGPNGETVEHIGSGCKVIIGDTEYVVVIAGDTSGDGKINLQDLAKMMRHMNGWAGEAYHDACDVDGDGKVSNRDYALLQRYLNGWDVSLVQPQ